MAGGGEPAGVAKVFRWEIAKLLAQKRTYLGLGVAMVVPIVFVVVLVLQTGGPNDVPLGRYIRDTGLAVPFVVLFFMSDRKSTRLNSSHSQISYAVFCLKKKKHT